MRITYFIFFLAFLSGCDQIKFTPIEKAKEEVSSSVVYSDTLTKVVEEAKKLTKEDRDYAFKQFSGLNQYILNSDIPSSDKIDVLIGRVQTDYKWGSGKYPTFTDVVSAYLKEKNYQKPVKFDTQVNRETTAAIFFDLADAVKKANE
jgi:hypothetical protein